MDAPITETPAVSVVIPTFNGADRLPATLAALARQTLPREDWEVVVIDDGSTDNTGEVAAAGGARVIRFPANRGVGAARNAGVAEARAPVLAFIDDDCIPQPDWLEQLIEPFRDSSVDGVGGKIHPAGDDGLMLRYLKARNPWAPLPAELLRSSNRLYRLLVYLKGLMRVGQRGGDPEELFAVAGANMAFRAELLAGVGGFDETYRVSEETELCRRAHSLRPGTRIVYRPTAVVGHHFGANIRNVLRRAHWYGEGSARFAAENDDVKLIAYPFPVLMAVAAGWAIATRRWRVLAAIPFVPVAAYPGWLLVALGRRDPEPVAYAYIQFAQEIATMAGEVSGVLNRGGRSAPSAAPAARPNAAATSERAAAAG